jgi:proteic killer suppression protein
MFIRNFASDRAQVCFEGGVDGLPLDVARRCRTVMHVLDSQGLDAVCLSYGASCITASEAFEVRIAHGWRICFVWKDGDALNVEIVDYH